MTEEIANASKGIRRYLQTANNLIQLRNQKFVLRKVKKRDGKGISLSQIKNCIKYQARNIEGSVLNMKPKNIEGSILKYEAKKY